jgi:hypothetical protein
MPAAKRRRPGRPKRAVPTVRNAFVRLTAAETNLIERAIAKGPTTSVPKWLAWAGLKEARRVLGLK